MFFKEREMSETKKTDSGAAGGTRRATEQSPESVRAGAGRWSSRRKTGVVLELLRGADLESTSRKYRVTVATLSDWRDRFLAAGEAGIKSRQVSVEDEEKRRLKSVVAGLSVEAELLREKIALIEGGRPLVSWESRTLAAPSRLPATRRTVWRAWWSSGICRDPAFMPRAIGSGTRGSRANVAQRFCAMRHCFPRFARFWTRPCLPAKVIARSGHDCATKAFVPRKSA